VGDFECVDYGELTLGFLFGHFKHVCNSWEI
jgi:hypothetical protein